MEAEVNSEMAYSIVITVWRANSQSVMALELFLFENSCTKEIIPLFSRDLNSIQFQFKINMYRLQRLKNMLTLTSSAKQQLLLTVDWGIKSVAES